MTRNYGRKRRSEEPVYTVALPHTTTASGYLSLSYFHHHFTHRLEFG